MLGLIIACLIAAGAVGLYLIIRRSRHGTRHGQPAKPSLSKAEEVMMIVSDYGALMERDPPLPTRIEDTSRLPYPKGAILDAQCVSFASLKDPKLIAAMTHGAICLAQYQPGVGAAPLHDLGFDINELGGSGQSLQELREEAKRLANNPTRERYEQSNRLVERDIERITRRLKELEEVRKGLVREAAGRSAPSE